MVSKVNNGRLTNHVTIVLDASSSMDHLTDAVIRTADELIKFLAEDSQKKDQETRVSVYTFNYGVTCHIWDMDVLRLPSMKEYYQPNGMTALIDATIQALDDGDQIPEKYGDHAHLVYVITDGYENNSKGTGKAPAFGRPLQSDVASQMKRRLAEMPENRSVALLVPDDQSAKHAAEYGLVGGSRGVSVALWDASSEAGLVKAVETIKTATASYTSSRATGLRSTSNLFTIGANVDAASIKAAGLTPLPSNARKIVPVNKVGAAFEKVVKPVTKTRLKPEMGWFVEIEKFVNVAHPPFRVGKAYYQLVKTEKVQGDKEVAVMEKSSNKVYVGDDARTLLGLPDHNVSVKPDANPDYEIYVQSSSNNRHLPIGTKLLILTN